MVVSQKMNTSTGRILVITGLVLQVAVIIGVFIMLSGLFGAFDAIGSAKDQAEAAGMITGGVADSLRAVVITVPIGLVGLILFSVAITLGGARERWVFRCGLIAMLPWFVLFPIGTLIGIVGLIFLLSKRRLFGAEKKEPDQAASVGADE